VSLEPKPSSAPPASPQNLLADLESRQEELLRQLSDLEERTKQALAQLSVYAAEPSKSGKATPRAA
jgi:hypothetical protein